MNYGILFHLNIHTVLIPFITSHLSNGVAVVRSIDSSCAKNDLEKILKFHGVSYSIQHSNIYLCEENLRKASCFDVFTGFDELWLFSDSPPLKNLTEVPISTSDGHDFSKNIDPKIFEAFQETKCTVLLADGCGLNYLTSDHLINQSLKKFNAKTFLHR